jgi:hypothetical protein
VIDEMDENHEKSTMSKQRRSSAHENSKRNLSATPKETLVKKATTSNYSKKLSNNLFSQIIL